MGSIVKPHSFKEPSLTVDQLVLNPADYPTMKAQSALKQWIKKRALDIHTVVIQGSDSKEYDLAPLVEMLQKHTEYAINLEGNGMTLTQENATSLKHLFEANHATLEHLEIKNTDISEEFSTLVEGLKSSSLSKLTLDGSTLAQYSGVHKNLLQLELYIESKDHSNLKEISLRNTHLEKSSDYNATQFFSAL